MSFDTIPKDTVVCDFTNGDRERLYQLLNLLSAIDELSAGDDASEHIKIAREHFHALISIPHDMGSDLYCELMDRAGSCETWGKRKEVAAAGRRPNSKKKAGGGA